eukprot:2061466-Pyramimonas_sp.AAC.1
MSSGARYGLTRELLTDHPRVSPCFLPKQHLRAIATYPRWLLVAVNAPGLRTNVLAGRAPRAGCDSTAAASIWGAFGGLVKSWGVD